MQISKSSLKLLIGCLLLFIFVVKLTSVTATVFKSQKGILIINEHDDSGADEKKDESKPAFSYNEFLNSFPESFTAHVIYYTICNLHPELLINFINTHYPTVLTPPPNC